MLKQTPLHWLPFPIAQVEWGWVLIAVPIAVPLMETTKGGKAGPNDTKKPHTKGQLHSWAEECTLNPCPRYAARRPDEVQAGGVHYHCVSPACPSLGLLGKSPPALIDRANKLSLHEEYHRREESKDIARYKAVWEGAMSSSQYLNRGVRSEFLTEFRRGIDKDTGAEGTVDWSSRLHIGKVGATASRLTDVLTSFGTCPGAVQALTETKHNPYTQGPLVGHTIEFVKCSDGGDVWFAVCTSKPRSVKVFGTSGSGYSVRWLEYSHRVTTENGSVRHVLTMSRAQDEQLLESMEDWGDLLEYDTEAGVYYYDPPADHETPGKVTDQALGTHQDRDTVDALRYLPVPRGCFDKGNIEPAAGAGTDTTRQWTREDYFVCRQLFPIRLLYFVTEDGRTPTNPPKCSRAESDPNKAACKWSAVERRGVQKLPVITQQGPIFIDPVRYFCGTHNSRVTAGTAATTRTRNRETEFQGQEDPFIYNLPYHRLRDMRYASSLLPGLQAQYVETLSVAATRRHLAGLWLSTAVGRLETLKRTQPILRLKTRELVAAASQVFALADLVPHRDSLTALQLVLYQNLVLPHMEKYDEAVCAFDGQVLKIDGTFKSASAVLAYGGSETSARGRRVTKRFKVASCVLVALGTEGLNLVTPRLSPAENSASITKMTTDILRKRRRVLGSLSAPAAFSTDHIRQHRHALMKGFGNVYPELLVAIDDSTEMEVDKSKMVLLLQDITHRLWGFTKRVATPKTHPDYRDYVADMKRVFHRLRLPHPAERFRIPWHTTCKEHGGDTGTWSTHCTDCLQSFRDAAAEATNQPQIKVPRIFKQKLERALLTPNNASTGDDSALGFAIDSLGIGLTSAPALVGFAIPPRVCIRGARRLGRDKNTIEALFPTRGYVDKEEFTEQVRSVNEFYRTVRSAAALETTHYVASQLGKPNFKRKHGRSGSSGSKRKRTTREQREVSDEVTEYWEGITMKKATEEVTEGIQEATTLKGLLGHGLIPGICTEETTVEAMNRALNSNVRQGCIGYDVAKMRLCYQRLKWDSSAIQRILAGDTTRKRRQNVQAMSVWNLAKLMLSHTTVRGVFTSQMLPVEKRTSVTDLIKNGYRLRQIGDQWDDEDVRGFFDACER